MRFRVLAAVTAALVTVAAFVVTPGTATASCQLHEVAELQAGMFSGGPIINGAINGVPVRILVDTGSAYTSVTLAAAKRLNLGITQLRADTAYGIGGAFKRYAASIKELKIDKFAIRNIALATAGDDNSDYDFDVLLGDDILSHYDVEFDLANDAIRLFDSSGCAAGELVYWGKPYSEAALVASDQDSQQIRAEVRLNGRAALAILDTGASISMVDAAVAGAAGVSRESPGAQSAQVIRGLGPAPEASFTGKFDTFALGDESIANARLHVTGLTRGFEVTELGSRLSRPLDAAPSMLIGEDFFHAHRIMVANRERVIVFSYNGGPIFTVAPDYAADMRQAKQAAAQGDVRAQYAVGELYQKGLGVPADDAEAVRWFKLAANQSNARAQAELGYIYSDGGPGVVPDAAEAARWYSLAAAQGDAMGQNGLGAMYEVGSGVQRNLDEGLRLFRLAADQGNVNAQANLGMAFYKGVGVKRDLGQARAWFAKAAAQGSELSMRWLAENPVSTKPGDAHDFYLRGVEQSDKGLYDQAISNYSQAITLAASDDVAFLASAYAKRGVAEDNKTLYDASIADLTKAMALSPRNPEAYSERGKAYSDKGLYDQAVADASQVVALAPGFPGGYNDRAWFLHLKGDDADALPDAERAVTLFPEDAGILETRAEIYEKLGRRDDALTDYRAAVKLAPNMKEAQAGLTRLGATP